MEIVNGPFLRQIGSLEHFDNKGRLRLLLSLLGRKTLVQLSTGDVIPVNK